MHGRWHRRGGSAAQAAAVGRRGDKVGVSATVSRSNNDNAAHTRAIKALAAEARGRWLAAWRDCSNTHDRREQRPVRAVPCEDSHQGRHGSLPPTSPNSTGHAQLTHHGSQLSDRHPPTQHVHRLSQRHDIRSEQQSVLASPRLRGVLGDIQSPLKYTPSTVILRIMDFFGGARSAMHPRRARFNSQRRGTVTQAGRLLHWPHSTVWSPFPRAPLRRVCLLVSCLAVSSRTARSATPSKSHAAMSRSTIRSSWRMRTLAQAGTHSCRVRTAVGPARRT